MSALLFAGVLVTLLGASVMAIVALTDKDPADYPPLASHDHRSIGEVLADVPDPDWAQEMERDVKAALALGNETDVDAEFAALLDQRPKRWGEVA